MIHLKKNSTRKSSYTKLICPKYGNGESFLCSFTIGDVPYGGEKENIWDFIEWNQMDQRL